MKIDGYAFKENEQALMAENRARYSEIEHHLKAIDMKRNPAYGKGEFRGTLKTDEEKRLSEKDLALLADRGNLCFGGHCTISGDRFSGACWTD